MVMAILAVLVAVLLPIFSSSRKSAQKIQVINDMRNINTSIINYYTDYRRYPMNERQRAAVENDGYDTVYGDPGGTYWSADFFNVLRAVSDDRENQNNILNPTETVYWQGQTAQSPTNPVSGITTRDVTREGNVIHKGSFVDPWGNQYIVWVDVRTDGDLGTAVGWFYKNTKEGDVRTADPPLGTAFGSMGADGKFGTKGDGILKGSDDIVSWLR